MSSFPLPFLIFPFPTFKDSPTVCWSPKKFCNVQTKQDTHLSLSTVVRICVELLSLDFAKLLYLRMPRGELFSTHIYVARAARWVLNFVDASRVRYCRRRRRILRLMFVDIICVYSRLFFAWWMFLLAIWTMLVRSSCENRKPTYIWVFPRIFIKFLFAFTFSPT